LFGRKALPKRCIIYAGSYVPARKEIVRSLFDRWKLVRGSWIPFAFAKKGRTEFLILFNVYGAAMTLEVLHLLKDGGVTSVFFVGSMFAKRMPVGTLVLPITVVDKAGIVSLDDEKATVVPSDSSLRRIRLALRSSHQSYREAKIASVPCVLHTIKSVKQFIENNVDVEGIELETSTFLHFSRNLHLKAYVLLYVSDTERVDIISGAKVVRRARRTALSDITEIAFQTL